MAQSSSSCDVDSCDVMGWDVLGVLDVVSCDGMLDVVSCDDAVIERAWVCRAP